MSSFRSALMILLLFLATALSAQQDGGEGRTQLILLGYRFTTPNPVIVISRDCRPSEKLAQYARGADVLLHEVYYARGLEESRRHAWKSYHQTHHTSTYELGRITAETQPGFVVMYHILFWGATEQDLLDEIAQEYDGRTVVGRDHGVY